MNDTHAPLIAPCDTCAACKRKGWIMTPEGQIQRCDECETFDSDVAAQEYIINAVGRFERASKCLPV